MKAQAIFDTVVEHLRRQNKQAITGMQCCYRLKSGKRVLKCAVGCLISDDIYDKTMEHIAIDVLLESNHANKLKYLKRHRGLLMDLQDIHDGDDYANGWTFDTIEALRNVARKRRLNQKALRG